MALTVTVTVTGADLDEAIKNRLTKDVCSGCLVAVAATRALGEPVEVGYVAAWVPGQSRGERRVELVLPDTARELIDEFDNANDVALRALLPVTFVLEAQ